jgi:hypothetical protein
VGTTTSNVRRRAAEAASRDASWHEPANRSQVRFCLSAHLHVRKYPTLTIAVSLRCSFSVRNMCQKPIIPSCSGGQSRDLSKTVGFGKRCLRESYTNPLLFRLKLVSFCHKMLPHLSRTRTSDAGISRAPRLPLGAHGPSSGARAGAHNGAHMDPCPRWNSPGSRLLE